MTSESTASAGLGEWLEDVWRRRGELPPSPNIVHAEHVKAMRLAVYYDAWNGTPSFVNELQHIFDHWSSDRARSFATRYSVRYEDLVWSHDFRSRLGLSKARLQVGFRRYPGLEHDAPEDVAVRLGYRRFPPVLRSLKVRRRIALRLHRRLLGWSWARIAKAEGRPFVGRIVTRAPDLKSVKRSVRALAADLGIVLTHG